MIIETALTQIYTKEIKGIKDNIEILKYFDIMGIDGAKMKDETAWCSAFANWVAIKAGRESSGALNARSWLNVGKRVDDPKQGDVVVFWRERRNSWKGHVAFFIRETPTHIYVLGGNQGNQVSIIPYRKNRLLQYRRI